MMADADWYLIQRVTHVKNAICVECQIDAVFAATSLDAIAVARTQVAVKTNQILRAIRCLTRAETQMAVTVHNRRKSERAEFEGFMDRILESGVVR